MKLNLRAQEPTATGRLLPAIAYSAVIAMAGYRRGALSGSGAAGALLVGTATYRAGAWRWSTLLLAFFVSSSALSRLESRGLDGDTGAGIVEKGSRRDLIQVLANGGMSAVAALACSLRAQDSAPPEAYAAAFAGGLAAANADTWATEIGSLSKTPPRLILNGQTVLPGASGGVTGIGLAGSAAGSLLIGVVAATFQTRDARVLYGAIVAVAGLVGSLADSVAGATIQASYICPTCEKPTERRIHHCGAAASLVRGHCWCTNDVVNLLCTACGGGAAAGLTALLTRRRKA